MKNQVRQRGKNGAHISSSESAVGVPGEVSRRTFLTHALATGAGLAAFTALGPGTALGATSEPRTLPRIPVVSAGKVPARVGSSLPRTLPSGPNMWGNPRKLLIPTYASDGLFSKSVVGQFVAADEREMLLWIPKRRILVHAQMTGTTNILAGGEWRTADASLCKRGDRVALSTEIDNLGRRIIVNGFANNQTYWGWITSSIADTSVSLTTDTYGMSPNSNVTLNLTSYSRMPSGIPPVGSYVYAWGTGDVSDIPSRVWLSLLTAQNSSGWS